MRSREPLDRQDQTSTYRHCCREQSISRTGSGGLVDVLGECIHLRVIELEDTDNIIRPYLISSALKHPES